ncbi:MAG: Hsp20/alpha crystallin family protein [Actinomycetota bacterium]|nr:Hsp20/alpha crystallin family protein [Actinomycetota bacterium]
MPIVRWDPFSDMLQLRDEIGRWFEGGAIEREKGRKSAIWAPDVDIKETDKEIQIKADLPGMKLEDIEVSVDDDQLIIQGERKEEKEEKEKGYIRVERNYGSFYRAFNIGVPVKADQIKATYKDGVLEITVPKAEAKKPKKIAITSK